MDSGQLVVDGGQLVVDGGQLVVDGGQLVVDGGQLVVDGVVDGGQLIADSGQLVVDRGQFLCGDFVRIQSAGSRPKTKSGDYLTDLCASRILPGPSVDRTRTIRACSLDPGRSVGH